MMRKACFIAVLLMLALAVGCGKGTKENKAKEEAFRIPDSLLAPIMGYHLTVDDYHVVNGGVMANAEIELHYPSSEIARYVAVKSFGYADAAYKKVEREIGKPAAGKLVLIGAADLDEYRLMTRKEWWFYGYVKGDTIIFEPFDILLKRSIAEAAIFNRIAQGAVNRRSGGKSPAWLREALASRIANEVEFLKIQIPEMRYEGRNIDPSPEAVESAIAAGTDRGDSRIAYYAAYRMLDNLLAKHSMDNVMSFLDRLKEGKTLDEASREAFGVAYKALIEEIRIDH
ncbi:MAG: hypothetical protein PHD74_02845 [Candidatus Krumholzibacteria bacterium]|nr:hypothetical protein [Candidatus Krumholzibacteria bacterium]